MKSENISKEDAERLLKALESKDKKIQFKLRKEKKAKGGQPTKRW